jgi:hypothetical protein
VVILGISLDTELDPAAFMKRMGYSYPILLSGGNVGQIYKVKLIPSLYVIDHNGKIFYRQAGVNKDDEKNLPGIIAEALAK